MSWTKLQRLQPSSARYTVWIGLLAIVVSALVTKVGAEIGFIGATVLVEMAIAVCLLWFFVEPQSTPFTSKLVGKLVFTGMAIGAVWVVFVAPDKPAGGFLNWKAHSFVLMVVGFVSATLTAPLFEEKVVRGLLFDGLSKHINSTLASILVSILFALAHTGAIVWAFCVSLTLCWLMLKYRLNTYQRAIVHGAINLVVMGWYFVS